MHPVMKNVWMIIAVFALIACSGQSKKHSEEQSSADTITEQLRRHLPDKPSLELNQGQKWKADSSTNNNVANLKSILAKFDAENNSSTDAYKQLGNDLQAGLDKMIKECKMGGADHDALHKWLEPLIKQVNDLKSNTDEKSAEAKTTEIREQLNVYSQFFE